MSTSELKTYSVLLHIRAECEDDARELIDDFTGMETDVEIINIAKVRE
jgi:hypothetical protein